MFVPDKASIRFTKGKSQTDTTGKAEIVFTVPGDPTPGSGDGRYLSGGIGWFDTPENGDYITVEIRKPDDSLLKSYSDTDMPADNYGWYIPKNAGYVKIKPMSPILGFLPSGLKLVIVAQKATATENLDFWCNLNWGIKE